MEQVGLTSVIQQEYGRITNKEEVSRIAQININNLYDFKRKSLINNLDKHTGDTRLYISLSHLKSTHTW
jgi:hypothetical protein